MADERQSASPAPASPVAACRWAKVRVAANLVTDAYSTASPASHASSSSPRVSSASVLWRNTLRAARNMTHLSKQHAAKRLSVTAAGLRRSGAAMNAIKAFAIEQQLLTYETSVKEQRMHIAWVLLFVAAYLGVGGAIFAATENWQYVTGLYFATVTMTTVGYGDLVPTSAGAQAFALAYGVFGTLYMCKSVVEIMVAGRELAVSRLQIAISSERPVASTWSPYVKIPLWLGCFSLVQLGFAAVYTAIAPSCDFGLAYWHAWTTATTIGYGDVTARLGATPSMHLYTTAHILLSVFWLAAMLADLQSTRGAVLARRRQEQLLAARIDGSLIPSLDRDGDGVDRIEYVIGMLAQMDILQWSDVQPFLDQFDAMDVDKSGRLDRKDLEAWTKQHDAADGTSPARGHSPAGAATLFGRRRAHDPAGDGAGAVSTPAAAPAAETAQAECI